MAHKLRNMVKQSSISTGSATIVLGGAALPPYRNFADALDDGDTSEVMVVNLSRGDEWQRGIYRYNSGVLTFLERLSSSTGADIVFSAGIKSAYIADGAERGVWSARDSSFNATPGSRYEVDASGGAITATMPASLSDGDEFRFRDPSSTWLAGTFAIDPNGHEFVDVGDGSDPGDPMTCDIPASITVVFSDGKLRVQVDQ